MSEPVAVDVSVEAPEWGEGSEEGDSWNDLVETWVRAALCDLILPEGAEVSVVLADDARVAELNGQWRNRPGSTNVLSFAANDGEPDPARWQPLLGDIVVAHGVAVREAREQAKRLSHHVAHLVIHGALHLVGLDHLDAGDAEAMEQRERRILASLGIADPYAAMGEPLQAATMEKTP